MNLNECFELLTNRKIMIMKILIFSIQLSTDPFRRLLHSHVAVCSFEKHRFVNDFSHCINNESGSWQNPSVIHRFVKRIANLHGLLFIKHSNMTHIYCNSPNFWTLWYSSRIFVISATLLALSRTHLDALLSHFFARPWSPQFDIFYGKQKYSIPFQV